MTLFFHYISMVKHPHDKQHAFPFRKKQSIVMLCLKLKVVGILIYVYNGRLKVEKYPHKFSKCHALLLTHYLTAKKVFTHVKIKNDFKN